MVIPTRDRWDLLARTLKGALAQEGVSIEVVVVDDGSTTKAPSWVSADTRVVACRSEVSHGVAHGRNIGIQRATGDWIAFLDHDDLWAPQKLRVQLDRAALASADFVYSAAVIVDGRLNPERVLRPPPSEELRGSIAVENVIPAGQSNVLARTGLVRELGGFNESYRYLADWEMWIRLAGAGAAAACPDVHVAYVMHDTSMHAVDRIPRTEFDKLASEYLGDRAARRKAKIFGAKWRAHGHRRAGHRLAASREYLCAGWAHRSPAMALRALAVLGGESLMGVGCAPAELPVAAEVAWLDRFRASAYEAPR